MAVKTDNVTAGKVLSATVQYDNSNDAQRAYDIKGEAYISNNAVQNVNNGYVYAKDSDVNASYMASFSSYGDSNLSINFNTGDKAIVIAITESVVGFIEDVKKNVDSKN